MNNLILEIKIIVKNKEEIQIYHKAVVMNNLVLEMKMKVNNKEEEIIY